MSQSSRERPLTKNVERDQFEIGDEILSMTRPAAVENSFPPHLVPEAYALTSTELTTPIGNSANIALTGMQSLPHTGHILP